MKKLLLRTFIIVIACSAIAFSEDFKEPTKTPTELTQEQELLIKEGINLHDQGRYDEAILKYEEVLSTNPDSILAIYEISFSYFAKKDFKKSLAYVEKGVTYKSEYLPRFYMQMASCLDYLGEPDKAIEIYKNLIQENPHQQLLNYNIALTYFQQGKRSDAVSYLKNELFLTPGHPTSNLLLGLIFRDNGINIPAIFALSRFLILEPRSERSAAVLESLHQLINMGVTKKDEQNIKITFDPNSNKDEGDFDSLQGALQIVSAGRFLEKNENKSLIEKNVEQFRSFFQIMIEMIGDETDKYKFSGQYYIPYFIDLKKNGHTEAFTYWIHSGSNDQEVTKWLMDNNDKVQEFVEWNNHYTWPKVNWRT